MSGPIHLDSFRSLFENAPLAYQSLDAEGRILLLNEAWSRLLGYEGEDLTGRHIGEFMTAESRELLQVRFADFKACGLVSGKDFDMIHRDGTLVPVRVEGRIATDDAGEFQQTHCILLDLREIHRTNEALIASERKYRRLVEMAQEGIWQIDEQSVTSFVNPAMARMLGYREEEMLGRPLFDFMDERGRLIAEKNVDRRRQGIAESHDFEFLHKDGRRIVAAMVTTPILNDEGEYAGAMAGLLDITERRQNEELLRVSAGHLQDAERIAGFGYWHWKLDESKIWNSPGLCRLFDVDQGRFEGTFDAFMARLHPEDRPDLERLIEQSLASGDPYETQFRVIHRDGTERTLSVVGRPLRNADGEIYALNGVAQDITESLHQQALLRHNEAQLNEAQRLARMGSWFYGPGETSRWWSDGMYFLHGIDPVQGVPSDEDYYAIVHPEDHDMLRGSTRRSLETGESYGIVYRILVDGAVRQIHSHGRVIVDECGEVGGIQGFSQDVTERLAAEDERRALEQQLLHSQKLESLGVLAGGLAHDFNNLLQAVLGNAHLALQGTAANTDQETLQCLLEVESAARRATDLCRQLLAYAGKGRLDFDDVDLVALIREMVEILDITISRKADLELRLPDTPLIVCGDSTQLNQVVMNLVTNSSEAMAGVGGRIVVEMTTTELGERELRARYPEATLRPGTYAVLTVSDDGCGMDEQVLQRLFDPFFSTKFTGRGLGLAAVLGIIKRHEGAIVVESRPGEGTRFEVALPVLSTAAARQPAAPAAADRPPAVEAPFLGRTVLVADDERMVLDLSVRMLKLLGCNVLAAKDGQEAVELFCQHRDEVDLVILDLTMPNMDGHEALHRIRKECPTACVVISSGYSGESVSANFEDESPDAFLAKPYELTRLQETLQTLL